ncbi:hypothetical protein GMMP15_730024 [Candidatus Magnetomoraceae bacterium gMMP-15]
MGSMFQMMHILIRIFHNHHYMLTIYIVTHISVNKINES